eukprot:jgi/Mesen1/6416/ME000329S05574
MSGLLQVQKYRRFGVYSVYYLGFAIASYTYANISIRAHVPQAATPYSGYAAGSELLFDVGKLYKGALANVFEEENWGVLEWTMMAKHFERHGQAPYAYHAHYMAHIMSKGQVDGSKPAMPGLLKMPAAQEE